jgi:hypothetical protein
MAYFRLAQRVSVLGKLDGWLRRRLRQVRWKDWKTTAAKRHNLRIRDISESEARKWAGVSRRYWRVAGSQILQVSLPNSYWNHRLDLGPLPGAVPCARAHAQQVLWEWGYDKLGEDAGLVVSELVTNAVTATRDLVPRSLAPARLWLASDTELVLILVGDTSPQPPVHVAAGPDSDSGRGLRLVEAMSGPVGLVSPPTRAARSRSSGPNGPSLVTAALRSTGTAADLGLLWARLAAEGVGFEPATRCLEGGLGRRSDQCRGGSTAGSMCPHWP